MIAGKFLYRRDGMWHGGPMRRGHVLWAMAVGAAAIVAACGQPPQKRASAEAQASQPELSRTGTVGLVRELKDRGMTSSNWTGVIGSLFSNDTEQDVIRVRYEVTIFYKDGTQGIVVVDQRPAVQTGQRVRVTGNRIDPL